jgi:general secretion pathway protein I
MSARNSTYSLPAHGRRLAPQCGFTLIEVLIAFVVLAVGLGTLMFGITTALRADAKVHNKRALDQITESRLEMVGRAAPLKIGRREGRIGRYRWREIVMPVQPDKLRPPDGAAPVGTLLTMLWVEIVVQDEAGAEARLAALKLAPGYKQ